MKSVLISIQPKWCELIASGKKTIEVRKTRPKIETLFKCYICTKYKTFSNYKIIGEFICDRIDTVNVIDTGIITCTIINGKLTEHLSKEACIIIDDLEKYLNGNRGYAYHISDLVIYDEPKELSRFRHCGDNYHFNPMLSRPPQSWCYVEELKRENKNQEEQRT